MDDHNKRILLLQLLIIFFVAFAVYANTLSNEFVFDDIPNILENRWIKDIHSLPEIFSTHIAGFDRGFFTSYYRPLIHVIFMGCYYLFGLRPWGFHLVNILFHSGVSILVFLIAARLISTFGYSTDPFPDQIKEKKFAPMSLPFLTAILFAVHPVHTEAVAWVSGVMDLSCSFFFLLALYLYIRSDGRFNGTYFLSTLSFFLALLCKEPAFMLPLLLFAYDYVLKGRKPSSLHALKNYGPFIVLAGIYLIVRFQVLGGLAPSRRFEDVGALLLIGNVFPLFIQYLGKLVFPQNLSVMNFFQPVTSFVEIRTLLAFVLSMVIAVGTYVFRREKILLFSIFLVVIPLLPALYIPGLGEGAFAERYLYLPSFGFVLFVATLFERLYRQLTARKWIVQVTVLTLMGFYVTQTVTTNFVWENGITLWTDSVEKVPGSAAAHEYLGYELYTLGHPDKAIEQYLIALDLDPRRVDAHINLSAAYLSEGLVEQSVRHSKIAVDLNPRSADAHDNLGLAYTMMGLSKEAISEYLIALSLNPDSANAHHNLGVAYGNQGLMDKAIEQFEKAVRLSPGNEQYRANLSMAYEARVLQEPNKGRGKTAGSDEDRHEE